MRHPFLTRAPRQIWKWEPIFTLLDRLELEVVYDGFSPEERTAKYRQPHQSNTDFQRYENGKIFVSPAFTQPESLLHEIAHHLECLRDRPHALELPNWGMDYTADTASGRIDQREDDEQLEAVACDIDVGIHVLWHWAWRKRAWELNLPDWWEDQGDTEEDWIGHRTDLANIARTYLEHALGPMDNISEDLR